jgi:putative intracellular protease/amidase
MRSMARARVWMPLPDQDFDPTESAVPWQALSRAGHEVVFATESGGTAPRADPRVLRGVLFGKMGAPAAGKAAYAEMEQSPAFQSPVAWSSLDVTSFDGLVLPGGHAPGMRPYLESETLRAQVRAFWKLARPVGAICHGVLVLARTRDFATGKSVIASRRTTCLTKTMELVAYYTTFWKLGRYYRTYDKTVQDEVKEALVNPAAQFETGPFILSDPSTLQLSLEREDPRAFVVQDGRYLSARWPGDAFSFANSFVALVEGRSAAGFRAVAAPAGAAPPRRVAS